MRRAIIRELKEAKGERLRKFELVDGSFQELGASMAHLVESVERITSALESLKGWKP